MNKHTNEHYAHYNDTYKCLLNLARFMNTPDPKQIFGMSDYEVTNSQLRAWRSGVNHKHFRPIQENEILAFIRGLVEWQKTQ